MLVKYGLMVKELAIIVGLVIAITVLYKLYSRRATPNRVIREPSKRRHDNNSSRTNKPESPPSGTEKEITLPEVNEEDFQFNSNDPKCTATETSLPENKEDDIQSKKGFLLEKETEVIPSDHNEGSLQSSKNCVDDTVIETSSGGSKEDAIQSQESFQAKKETEIIPSDYNKELLQLNDNCVEDAVTETSSGGSKEDAIQSPESFHAKGEAEITPSDYKEELLQSNNNAQADTTTEVSSCETSTFELNGSSNVSRATKIIPPDQEIAVELTMNLNSADVEEKTFAIQDASSENVSNAQEHQYKENDTSESESKDASGIIDESHCDQVGSGEENTERNNSEEDKDSEASEYEGQDLTSQSAQLEIFLKDWKENS